MRVRVVVIKADGLIPFADANLRPMQQSPKFLKETAIIAF
jgi:hypothetical protein